MRKPSHTREVRLLRRLYAHDDGHAKAVHGEAGADGAASADVCAVEGPLSAGDGANGNGLGGMCIIAGLGNPGDEYWDTRHNAGFRVIDLIAGDVGAAYWKNECGCLTSHVKRGQAELVLAKPQGFMNNSGGPLRRLMDKYSVPSDRMIVIHDDMDIASGSIKVKLGGGHAGHNGLRSIIDKIGTRYYPRVRIGIGRPPGRMPVVDFVLSPPRSDAAKEFDVSLHLGAEAALFLVDEGVAKAQDKYNGVHAR